MKLTRQNAPNVSVILTSRNAFSCVRSIASRSILILSKTKRLCGKNSGVCKRKVRLFTRTELTQAGFLPFFPDFFLDTSCFSLTGTSASMVVGFLFPD